MGQSSNLWSTSKLMVEFNANPLLVAERAQAPRTMTQVQTRMGAHSFAYTSPYGGFWVEKFYRGAGHDLFGEKVVRECDFRDKLHASGRSPEIMLMGNFIVERAGIISLCRELGINTVHGEDGFFPHYSTVHMDPLGFCWESSLARMVFRQSTDRRRRRAESIRAEFTSFAPQELHPFIKKPFVLWPLQLIGDKVNQFDLQVEKWTSVLNHFRRSLPPEYQLVVKVHPRSKDSDMKDVEKWARDAGNVVLVPRPAHLQSLLLECAAVAGANSTVLYEARLIFRKPVYAYARSWFTGHTELFTPVHLNHKPRMLNRFDLVEDNRKLRSERLDDYVDWFLTQLLDRQSTHTWALENPEEFAQRVQRLSYNSFLKYGEEIFDEC